MAETNNQKPLPSEFPVPASQGFWCECLDCGYQECRPYPDRASYSRFGSPSMMRTIVEK